jgi:hypothetical protein
MSQSPEELKKSLAILKAMRESLANETSLDLAQFGPNSQQLLFRLNREFSLRSISEVEEAIAQLSEEIPNSGPYITGNPRLIALEEEEIQAHNREIQQLDREIQQEEAQLQQAEEPPPPENNYSKPSDDENQ